MCTESTTFYIKQVQCLLRNFHITAVSPTMYTFKQYEVRLYTISLIVCFERGEFLCSVLTLGCI